MPNSNPTQRLTVGQAVVQFLAAQRVERDGDTQPFFGGAIGIFGHGNVAGIGQALLQYRKDFRLYQARNEQGMVHMATGYAKAKNRLGAIACSTSIGPGATNMITGAATATVNRLPVLCLPSDIFASRRTGPVLQQLESSFSWDSSASDAFKPVSKYWDRINRPDQLPTALLEAMRTLTSPADTGAVTISLPQDVQAEAWDFPTALFRERTWHVPRARADRAALRRAAQVIGAAKRPVIIAGGGVIYSAATAELADFVAKTGIPVGVTQAGKASLPYDHPQMVDALGASGSVFANALANEADVIIGIGTRYTDFTTASNTLFTNPDVQFVNINVTELDAYKESGLALIGDARETLTELADLLTDYTVEESYRSEVEKAANQWRDEVDRIVEVQNSPTLVSGRSDRDCELRRRRPSRRGQRRRFHARRPAPALAAFRSQGLRPGVRKLVHGIRGRRGFGRQDGRPEPRRLLLHRRRHLPHGQPGDHDRRPGRPQADGAAGRQLRLRIDRGAVGDPRIAGLRL